MNPLILGEPSLYIITGRMWESDVPLALVEATSTVEAIEVFWERADNNLLEFSGMGGSPDKKMFSARPVDLSNGYQWIGALS